MIDDLSPSVGDDPQVMLATASDALLDDLLRLCAAAGATPVVAADPVMARRWWGHASLIVVGDDLAAHLAPPVARRSAVVVLTRTKADPGLYQQAMALGAEQVVTLRDDEDWLVEQMGVAGDGHARAAVVAVVGCRGGAGTSTLMAAVGRQAVAERLSCALVDADPGGADLDLLLDMAGEPGLRWDDLAEASGRLPASTLAAALPRNDGLALLCARDAATARRATLPQVVVATGVEVSPAPPPAMTAVLGALARGFDLVLVDVPRGLPPTASPALALADLVLVSTTADLRGVAAGRRVVAALDDHGPPLRLVVRTGRSGSADPDQVAHWLGVPLAARVPYDQKVAADGDRGELVVRSSLRRASRAVLAEVAQVGGRVPIGTHT
ncbi:MAG: septum site-determining protein Ssd [Jiangellales bacterium]